MNQSTLSKRAGRSIKIVLFVVTLPVTLAMIALVVIMGGMLKGLDNHNP